MTKTARSSAKRATVQVLHPAAPTGEASPDAEALHRVRDLLFGEASREQAAHVDALAEEVRSDLRDLRKELRDEASSLREEIQVELEALRSLQAELESAKVARKDLASLFVSVADELAPA
ncbi:MAG: hypothetical protein AAF368_19385 [Planctomycetota bacterium]